MGDRWYWKGSVRNHSSQYLWALFDEGEVVFAKLVLPNKKSPFWTDVDAIKAYHPETKINGHDSWWKLGRGADAAVADFCKWESSSTGLVCSPNDLVIGVGLVYQLVKTQESDWATIKYDEKDILWGEDFSDPAS